MTTVVRVSPIRNYLRMPEAPRSLFDDAFRSPAVWSRRRYLTPAENLSRLFVDAYETEHEIVVQAAFPGVAPEGVQVTVEGDSLTLSAELPAKLENVNYAFSERPHGRVTRQLALSVAVDVDKAEANFENGLLTLTLPKVDTARPKTISVSPK